MSLSSVAPEFSAAFAKLHVRRAIKSVMMMAEVMYEDGGKDTLDLNEQGMLAVLMATTRTPQAEVTEEVKVVPMPQPEEKAKGTPKAKVADEKEEKPRQGFIPKAGRWIPESEWIGECEYTINGDRVHHAILKDKDTKWQIARTVVVKKTGKRIVAPSAVLLTVNKANPKLFGAYLYKKAA